MTVAESQDREDFFGGSGAGAGSSKRVRPDDACKLASCYNRADGSDRLCGYHRALAKGPAELEKFRDSGRDWRAELFADFDRRHADDLWGSAVRIANDTAAGRSSREDVRELVALLRDRISRIGEQPVRSSTAPAPATLNRLGFDFAGIADDPRYIDPPPRARQQNNRAAPAKHRRTA